MSDYTDPQTKEYWQRVRAALKFCEGYPTEVLGTFDLSDVLAATDEATEMLDALATQLRMNGHSPVVNHDSCVGNNRALLATLQEKDDG